MISIILVDDEIPALEEMKYHISSYSDFNICGMYTNPMDSLEAIKLRKPDVVFLDIDMPYINGMEFASKIRSITTKTGIVFVTAYKEFSLQAFEVNALDYILKPIENERFKKTMIRIIDQYKNRRTPYKIKKPIYIQCFGKFIITENGIQSDIIKWRTKKVKELFAYLIYRHEKSVSKYELIKLLFDRIDKKKALNNLYVTIYYLRKHLEDLGIDRTLILIRDDYSLEIASGICDYTDFDRFLKNNIIIDEENIHDCEKIIESYKGGFLEEDDYSWAYQVREYLAKKYEDLLLSMADYYITVNKRRKAEKTLLKLVNGNPLSEEGNRRLLDIYITCNNIESYVKQYEVYEKLLIEEFVLIPEKKYSDYYSMIRKKKKH